MADLAQLQTRYQILEALRKENGVVSGGELAEKLGITRTAVWKAVSSLQQEGYQIEALPQKGYRLLECEVYSGYEIQRRLNTGTVGHPLIFMEEIGSTNDYVKELAAQGYPSGTTVVARRQTGGKGRLGRTFVSPAEGVYYTVLLRPEAGVEALSLLTILAAEVSADTIEQLTGVRPGVKWINDLYLKDRKICGILTECSVEGESGRVSYAAVGIGMNLHQKETDFPPELRDKAGSVEMLTGKHVPAADYAAAALKHFDRLFFEEKFPENQNKILRQYRQDLFFLGREVEVRGISEQYPATALDIDAQGRLLVRDREGRLHTLNSGEISIRF